MAKYALDFTVRDLSRKLGAPVSDIKTFYIENFRLITNNPICSNQADYNVTKRETIVDYLYESFGRPKWFVDREVFGLLSTLETDNDLSGIFFPHDVFTLVFEEGTEINGIPLRTLRVCRHPAWGDKPGPAKLTQNFLKQLNVILERKESTIDIIVDSGENSITGAYSWETPISITQKWNWARRPKQMEADFKGSLNEKEAAYMVQASKILVSALLYYAAKPDHVVPFVLPRSQRYGYNGDKNTYRRFLAPQASSVYEHRHVESGRTVRGHYRGWVLRTLRHEKYLRNDDGTFKVVLIEPVVVKGGPDGIKSKL